MFFDEAFGVSHGAGVALYKEAAASGLDDAGGGEGTGAGGEDCPGFAGFREMLKDIAELGKRERRPVWLDK
jgi:glutamate synthase domain-containing protein 2